MEQNPPDSGIPDAGGEADEATRVFAAKPAGASAPPGGAGPFAFEPTGAPVAAPTAPVIQPPVQAPVIQAPAGPVLLTPGTILGHTYEIEAVLARGGMGEVLRARHIELGTLHAIKVILPDLARDERIVSLFREEARKLRMVRDDAVIHYDGLFLDENGLRYLVMEFADGPSLAQILTQRRLEPAEVRSLRDRMARGLAAAHEADIVHRDISPDNVILVQGHTDRAKIIDFGIAKSTEPGAVTIIGDDFAGKYSYVSPEQLGMFGGKIDGRSDIYSLGLVLAAAAIGRPLPMGNSPASVVVARQGIPDLGEIPAELREEIAPLLEPDPARRPQSMRDLPGVKPAGYGNGRGGTALRSEDNSGIAELMRSEQARRDREQQETPPAGQAGVPAAAPAGKSKLGLGLAIGAVLLAAIGAGGWFLLGPGSAQHTAPTGPAATSPAPAPAAPVPAEQPPAAAPAPAMPAPVATAPEKPSRQTIEAAAQALFSRFDCAGLRLDLGDGLSGEVHGFVSRNEDLQSLKDGLKQIADAQLSAGNVAVYAAPFCQIAGLLQDGTRDSGPPVAFNKPSKSYRDGEKLVVSLEGGTGGYLYVDYIDSSGAVVHMLPAPAHPDNLMRPGEKIVLGTDSKQPRANEQVYEISEPYGANLITVIQSPRPLFTQPRPETETLGSYAGALRAALDANGTGASSSLNFFEATPR